MGAAPCARSLLGVTRTVCGVSRVLLDSPAVTKRPVRSDWRPFEPRRPSHGYVTGTVAGESYANRRKFRSFLRVEHSLNIRSHWRVLSRFYRSELWSQPFKRSVRHGRWAWRRCYSDLWRRVGSHETCHHDITAQKNNIVTITEVKYVMEILWVYAIIIQ